MNSILSEILRSNQVIDAEGKPRPLTVNMNQAEGELIVRVFEAVKPDLSLEVGFAYGVSTLFACSALARNAKPARHIVIDPCQSSLYDRIGLLNIERAGYERFVELIEEPSEIALPRLLHARTRVQAAIIDGWHTFDHGLVDFFYVNKMLDPGGVVIFDDVNMPAIARLISHVLTYPAYRLFDATPIARAPNPFVALRRRLNGGGPSTTHSRDNPSCIALRKTTDDIRDWDWHRDF
jgi:predicted O-methyltransferase YrrM